MEWTNETPRKQGIYWCHQKGKTRMVIAWGCPNTKGERLYTNEDGGALITDRALYANTQWYGPIKEPAPPSNAGIKAARSVGVE